MRLDEGVSEPIIMINFIFILHYDKVHRLVQLILYQLNRFI